MREKITKKFAIYIYLHYYYSYPPALSEQSQFSAWCKYLLMASGPKGCQAPNYTLAPNYHYSYPPSAFGTEPIQRLVQVTY